MTPAEFKCLRSYLGLTTDWLATRWHVSRNSVQRWEHNRKLPADFDFDIRNLYKTFIDAIEEYKASPAPVILVPRVKEESGEYPQSWYQNLAWHVRESTGKRILFVGDDTEIDDYDEETEECPV